MTLIGEAERRLRYAKVMQSIRNREQFSSHELYNECHEEQRAFITRCLKQLTSENVLQVIESDEGLHYSWKADRDSFSIDAWVDRQFYAGQITQSPIDDRPRERLMTLGAENLRTAELLAILIRTGRRGESALQSGEKLAGRMKDDLQKLRQLSHAEYRAISPVVTEAAYCQILAGIELGRRVEKSIKDFQQLRSRIDSVEAAKQYCARAFQRLAVDRCQEEFHIVTLDTKLQPLHQHQITVGTLDASLVSPREVFRPAIRDAAAAVLLVHNHPSGDPTPSRQDFQVTEALDNAAKIIGIQIIDHIVVASSGMVSIREMSR